MSKDIEGSHKKVMKKKEIRRQRINRKTANTQSTKRTVTMTQPNLNSSDYYEILGCNRNADDNTLKKAYRKLAVKVRKTTIS